MTLAVVYQGYKRLKMCVAVAVWKAISDSQCYLPPDTGERTAAYNPSPARQASTRSTHLGVGGI